MPDDENRSRDVEARLLALFRAKFFDRPVTRESSLRSIGIDSMSIARELEREIGRLPRDWRSLSIAELARLDAAEGERPVPAEAWVASRQRAPISRGTENLNPKGISFWALVREDLVTHDRDPFSQGFWAVFCNRFGNWRMGIRWRILRAPMTLLYLLMRRFVQILCGIKLDYTVRVGRRVKLEHFGGMILGARSIGDDVYLRQNTTLGTRNLSDLAAKPTIEEGVTVGAGAVIIGDVVVGRHSRIGANAVVDFDVPPFSTVKAPRSTLVTPGQRGAERGHDDAGAGRAG